MKTSEWEKTPIFGHFGVWSKPRCRICTCATSDKWVAQNIAMLFHNNAGRTTDYEVYNMLTDELIFTTDEEE